MALLDQQCANRVATGAAVGGALGASIGTCVELSLHIFDDDRN